MNRDKPRAGRLPLVPQLVMLYLSRDSEKWHASTDIIGGLGIEPRSLAQLLYPSVQDAYLRRRGSPDQRGFEYQLAEKGKAHVFKLLNPQPLKTAVA